MPDSQLIAILVAAMVAGVVLFRLYTVLGRRTGHEPQPDKNPLSTAPLREATAPRPGSEAPEPMALPPEGACARALLDIEMADPSFDRDHFIKGARTAYEIIQKAFADGDRLALRPLLSDEVYAAFEGEIANRTAPAARLTQISDARITGAELSGPKAEITMAFRASFTGADNIPHDVADHWSFMRIIGAADPNWTLVATAGENS